MNQDSSAESKDDVKSRMREAVPHPDPAANLSEADRRGLELQGEIEHTTGKQREEIAERAKDQSTTGK
jgi:hypothetical protein